MSVRVTYLWRNLVRNPLRTGLTCAAVALPMVIYVLSWAVVDGVNRFLENSSRMLRLAVTHKASIINPLPEGYRAKIEALDPDKKRIIAVCGLKWIGGKVENDPRPLSSLGADADTFIDAFPDYYLTDEEKAAWLKDRRAIILGRNTAAQFGVKTGDRITIKPSLPPYNDMEFNVVSTAEQATDPVTNWFHREYFEESLRNAHPDYYTGTVSFFFVKCASKEDLDYFRTEIDKTFARSVDETKTQDEKAFMNEFVTQNFNLPRNLTILSIVTVFVAVMAATNTMGMNFRDRLNEYATLKSLGFGGGYIFGLVQAESLLLCGLGGAVGAAVPYIAFNHTRLGTVRLPMIEFLLIEPNVCGQAVAISLVVGLIAAMWPSWKAMRMRVVSALRNLE